MYTQQKVWKFTAGTVSKQQMTYVCNNRYHFPCIIILRTFGLNIALRINSPNHGTDALSFPFHFICGWNEICRQFFFCLFVLFIPPPQWIRSRYLSTFDNNLSFIILKKDIVFGITARFEFLGFVYYK